LSGFVFIFNCILMKKTNKLLPVFIVVFLSITLIFSCGNDDEVEIPYVYVNFSINPGSIEYGDLEIPGNFAYVTGGYKGIIIYHYTQNVFIAYERACTHDPLEPGAQVKVDEGMLLMECPVCGSGFLLTNGSRFEGPATQALRTYQTYYDGNLLYVSN